MSRHRRDDATRPDRRSTPGGPPVGRHRAARPTPHRPRAIGAPRPAHRAEPRFPTRRVLRPVRATITGAAAGTLILSAAVSLPTSQPVAQRPHAEESPQALIAKHDCWTGTPPGDQASTVPGHVIVSTNGRTVHAGPRMVAKALDQVFEGSHPELTVHAFCP